MEEKKIFLSCVTEKVVYCATQVVKCYSAICQDKHTEVRVDSGIKTGGSFEASNSCMYECTFVSNYSTSTLLPWLLTGGMSVEKLGKVGAA